MKEYTNPVSHDEAAELRHFLEKEKAEMAVEFSISYFETRRQMNRIVTALLLSANGAMPLPEAYKKALLDEKTMIMNVLRYQFAELSKLRTPKAILKSKENEVKVAEAAVRRIQALSPKRLANQLAKTLRNQVKEDAINLTTCFVDSFFALYSKLADEKNGALKRRLLAQ